MAKKSAKREVVLQKWQFDPNEILSKYSHVQYWRSGVMVTGQMELSKARQLVSDGHAFVMCAWGIGALVDGKPAV